MALINTICLIVGYVVMGCVLLTLIALKIRRLRNWFAGTPSCDASTYYMGPQTPCACEYHPQNVCCICGQIEGATGKDWKHVQPPS